MEAVAVGPDVGLDSDQRGGMLLDLCLRPIPLSVFGVAELRSAWTAGGGCPYVPLVRAQRVSADNC